LASAVAGDLNMMYVSGAGRVSACRAVTR
jgi:hypothetical protein